MVFSEITLIYKFYTHYLCGEYSHNMYIFCVYVAVSRASDRNTGLKHHDIDQQIALDRHKILMFFFKSGEQRTKGLVLTVLRY